MNAAIRRAAGLTAHFCASCVFLSSAAAEEFSWQVSGSYLDGNADSALDTHHRWLRATYHLSPVDDATGPLELAPFLSRSSYVAVGTGRTRLREETFQSFGVPEIVGNSTLATDPPSITRIGENPAFSAFPSESGFDSSGFAVEGRYVWPASGWYAGAHARRGDGDATPRLPIFRTTTEYKRTGLFAGRYVGPRTAVELAIGSETTNEQVRMTVPGFKPLFGLPHGESVANDEFFVDYEFGLFTDADTDHAAVSVRHVGSLGGLTFALSAAVSASRAAARFALDTPPELVGWEDPADWPVGRPAGPFPAFAPVQTYPSEREREVSISGTLFPLESLGVRLSASTSDHDTWGTSELVGLSANWYFVRNAALGIELTRRSSTGGYVPDARAGDAVSLRLIGRF